MRAGREITEIDINPLAVFAGEGALALDALIVAT